MDEKVFAGLIDICRRYILSHEHGVIIPEPYVPFVPPRWNGILVLGEAQNLATDRTGYREWIEGCDREKRFRRLPRDHERIGVKHWDDGSLPVALSAALIAAPNQTSVSNAVLWSQSTAQGRNANPSEALLEKSAEIWSEMLLIIRPKTVVAAGSKAKAVITKAMERARINNVPTKFWRLPSPQTMSRISGMFSTTDLLSRYPEVARIAESNPHWFEDGNRPNKIFFACHAVSIESKGSA